MNKAELTGRVEAIIFASGEPMSLGRIAQVLEVSTVHIEECIERLKEKYNTSDGGVHIITLEDEVQLCTNPAFVQSVQAALDLRRNTPLSQAALEVLAVIAYNQPVTKAFVEQVRGVDCSGVIGSLVQKGLLEERGRLELPGRPLLYGTTPHFLTCMHIQSLSQLPPPPVAAAQSAGEASPRDMQVDDTVQIMF